MKRILLLVLSIVALVLALILGTMQLASADSGTQGSQIWYLDSINGAAPGSLQMEREYISTSGSVDIAAGGNMTWVTDVPAGHDIAFSSSESWILTLNTDKNWAPNTDMPKITVKMGGYNPVTGSYYYFTTSTGAKAYMETVKNILEDELATASETINEGDYLVVQVSNNDTTSHPVYFVKGASNLISPYSDPGYPLPELAAGILLAGGLIGLASYVAIRRRKVRQMNIT